jgi:hypothetical protein
MTCCLLNICVKGSSEKATVRSGRERKATLSFVTRDIFNPSQMVVLVLYF